MKLEMYIVLLIILQYGIAATIPTTETTCPTPEPCVTSQPFTCPPLVPCPPAPVCMVDGVCPDCPLCPNGNVCKCPPCPRANCRKKRSDYAVIDCPTVECTTPTFEPYYCPVETTCMPHPPCPDNSTCPEICPQNQSCYTRKCPHCSCPEIEC